ncbi:hypothetical protein AMS68_005398 [Peltaster fructicola]|uniref:Dipeptidase n=1 Tax=Peltaster fructicola TaxID=286661 RepID=A0A6H0XYY7_9PEZI|nr:hypothetical protein AMS68_005398 [Peltaster fructicola]
MRSVLLLGLLSQVVLCSWSQQRVLDNADKQDARSILERHPLIDGHNDLLILLRYLYHSEIYSDNFTDAFEKTGLQGQVDLPRIDEGQLGGAFWSAFVLCPDDPLDFSDAAYAPYVKQTFEQIDLFYRLQENYPDYFTLSRSAAEAERNFKDGYLISPLAIEGLHQIGNSLATLRLYHRLGVRYATLTWNCHNKYADAALLRVEGETVVAEPYWHGVSKAGEELILEMNRLGMLVDLSHTSVDTQRDVLGGGGDWNGSRAAPIFSHSSVFAICPHPRNVNDEILELVKKRGSLVMINFSSDFVSCRASKAGGLPEYVPENNTIDHVVKHITYIGELIGYDHVGIGTDYDGSPSLPRGLEDVSKFPALVSKLLEQGLKPHIIAKVIGGNLLRVWHEADRVARELQNEIDPIQDHIKF